MALEWVDAMDTVENNDLDFHSSCRTDLRETPLGDEVSLIRRRVMRQQQPWAIILAGGNGTRLRSLTRRISGDERPKQFCSLCGDHTLLTQTRLRLSRAIAKERTLFSVVREHERFYARDLADVSPSRMAVQPSNKGTTIAIISSLHRLLEITPPDEDPIVGFFPTDHYYANEERFVAAVRLAFEVCQRRPESLLLLGAEAQSPEVEYGWIEPTASLTFVANSLFRVNRFWEKPSLHVAQMLLARSCLWNTFVLIGRAKMFLDMLTFAAPGLLAAFETLGRHDGAKTLDDVYATIPSGDFSHEVLSVCTEWLSVLRLGNVGWSDLGTPERVASVTRGMGAS
jgi:mannose-1-phosphate guanylyltransferase